MSKPETITLDNVKYVRADKQQMAEKIDGMEYVRITHIPLAYILAI